MWFWRPCPQRGKKHRTHLILQRSSWHQHRSRYDQKGEEEEREGEREREQRGRWGERNSRTKSPKSPPKLQEKKKESNQIPRNSATGRVSEWGQMSSRSWREELGEKKGAGEQARW
ncbi:hypothetical protein PDE_08195 [Penicillium oxalicum 114-2]|uniref:Uncharacterized protein n=1 Tax=Penicillium oxalicum (strain 114-2 / CGMCC 5302) TaxID=933388 RepID=S8B314_PENO1|nr:hypothetical protein PDE_08195 [Penicillium oxalicum 114-2]